MLLYIYNHYDYNNICRKFCRASGAITITTTIIITIIMERQERVEIQDLTLLETIITTTIITTTWGKVLEYGVWKAWF